MRVWITGTGTISSLGNSPTEIFDALKEMRGSTQYFKEWSSLNGLHSYVAAPAKEYGDVSRFPRKARRTMTRMSEMMVVSVGQALRQADLNLEGDCTRTLMILGSTTGSPATFEEYFTNYINKGGPDGVLSGSFFKTMSHSVAANSSVGHQYLGPLFSPSSACSTSTQAMILGWELLQTGLYDVVIAGGADELTPHSVAVFDGVMAASRGYNDQPDSTPRPFDSKRDGLVVSEGAAVVILESEKHAKQRGAQSLGEFLGGAYIADGSHMSQPKAESMLKTMQLALDRAGLEPSKIDYVNAHATGTVIGDAEEAKATHALVGDRAGVSSLKGHFGHSLAACGTLELICSLEMLRNQTLIPTRNLENPDPVCNNLRLLREVQRASATHVLSNNFAFGGMNASIVVSACEG